MAEEEKEVDKKTKSMQCTDRPHVDISGAPRDFEVRVARDRYWLLELLDAIEIAIEEFNLASYLAFPSRSACPA